MLIHYRSITVCISPFYWSLHKNQIDFNFLSNSSILASERINLKDWVVMSLRCFMFTFFPDLRLWFEVKIKIKPSAILSFCVMFQKDFSPMQTLKQPAIHLCVTITCPVVKTFFAIETLVKDDGERPTGSLIKPLRHWNVVIWSKESQQKTSNKRHNECISHITQTLLFYHFNFLLRSTFFLVVNLCLIADLERFLSFLVLVW